MFPVGLAALEGGYDQGAQDYWKRRELESIGPYGAGLRALLTGQVDIPGATAAPGAPMSLSPGDPGSPNFNMSLPGPIPPPQQAPPQVAGGPRYSPIPYTPVDPSAPSNPLMVSGQPQNLTGPIIPPGGTGGAGSPPVPAIPGGMRMPPPMSAGGAPSAPPPSSPSAPGAPGAPGPSVPSAGGLGGVGLQGPNAWMSIGRAILQANPHISDDQLGFAINRAMPLMNAQSQMEWKNIQLEMERERNRLLLLQIQERSDIAGRREEGLDRRAAGREEGLDRRSQLSAAVRREGEAGRMQRAELSSQTKLELRRLSDNTRREITDILEKGRDLRTSLSAEARKEIAKMNRESREEMFEAAEEGRDTRSRRSEEGRDRRSEAAETGRQQRQQTGIEAQDRRQQRQIEAAGQRQQTGIEAARERQQTGIEATRERQGERLAAKLHPQIGSMNEALREIDTSIADLQDSQRGGPPVAGISGAAERWLEWGRQMLQTDEGDQTRATVFETRIRALQAQVPRLLAGVGRISNEERAKIDNIVRGLGTFTSPQQAINALTELRNMLSGRLTPNQQVQDRFPDYGGRDARSRQSQQPPPAPTKQLVPDWQEGEEIDFKAPDGSVHTWVLRNGEAIEVRGGQ